jgi:hypothetical protein
MLDNPTLLEKLFPEVLSRYALKGVELAATWRGLWAMFTINTAKPWFNYSWSRLHVKQQAKTRKEDCSTVVSSYF